MELDAKNLIPSLNKLSRDEKLEVISYLANQLKTAAEEISKTKKEISIPIGVFGNDSLSSLEAIVKYLKEDLKLGFSEIARLTNRSSKTIWTTYKNAAKKMPPSFGLVSGHIAIPVSVFANRSFSTLECIVGFIKNLGYSNHEIALMLHLDDRTVWTVYDRVKRKKEHAR